MGRLPESQDGRAVDKIFKAFAFAFVVGVVISIVPTIIVMVKASNYVRIDPLPDDAYARAIKVTLPRVEVLNNGKTLHFQTFQPTEKDFENLKTVSLFPLFSAAQDRGHNLRPTTPDENFVVFQILSERTAKNYCLHDYEGDLSTDPLFATKHPAVIEMCKKYNSHPR